MTPSRDIARLIEIMAALRAPNTGCPWDVEQTFETIAPYTIEEAYEVADAIARRDRADLKDELGDLLLQVVYHARMAEEEQAFKFDDVVLAVTTKMIRRHPHVFGDEQARTAGVAKDFWNAIKAEEKAAKALERAKYGGGKVVATKPASLLDDVPIPLPALTRAIKLQDKAARVGFDWPSITPVFAKMREELLELEEVVAASDKEKIQDEFGDLLFVMANVARHLDLDPEAALRQANQKFSRRFAHIEGALAASGRTPEQSNLDEMDALWNDAKLAERQTTR